MPYTVFIIHTHMTHLHRKKIFEGWLPYIFLVYILSDLKNICLVLSITNNVHTRILCGRKIKLKIMVPQKISPVCRLCCDNLFVLSVHFNTKQTCFVTIRFVFVKFDYSNFLLQWMITHLRYLYYRI